MKATDTAAEVETQVDNEVEPQADVDRQIRKVAWQAKQWHLHKERLALFNGLYSTVSLVTQHTTIQQAVVFPSNAMTPKTLKRMYNKRLECIQSNRDPHPHILAVGDAGAEALGASWAPSMAASRRMGGAFVGQWCQ